MKRILPLPKYRVIVQGHHHPFVDTRMLICPL
jgi:hypothetical protein